MWGHYLIKHTAFHMIMERWTQCLFRKCSVMSLNEVPMKTCLVGIWQLIQTSPLRHFAITLACGLLVAAAAIVAASNSSCSASFHPPESQWTSTAYGESWQTARCLYRIIHHAGGNCRVFFFFFSLSARHSVGMRSTNTPAVKPMFVKGSQ